MKNKKNGKRPETPPSPPKKNFILPLVTFVVGLALGSLCLYILTQQSFDSEEGAAGGTDPGKGRFRSYELRQKGYQFISPLLECSDNMNDSFFSITRDLKRQIEKKISEFPSVTASVYYRDLTNGPVINVNPNERFSPASLTKIPVMISYLKYAEDHPEILAKRLKYLRTPVDLQVMYQPTRTLKADEMYTVEQLIFYMIAYSDNGARGTLVSDVFANAQAGSGKSLAVPIDFYSEIFTNLGLDSPDEEDPRMTAKQVASFFRILYNASYLDRKYSEMALNVLSQSTFDNGLTQKLPRDVVVARKFGEDDDGQFRSLHECGIIYAPQHPYILCVMTKGKDNQKQAELISSVSRVVFEEIEKGGER